MNNSIRKFCNNLLKEISKSKNILIASHVDPDIDALSSEIALFYILKKKFKNKNFFLFNPDKIKEFLEINPDFKLIKNKLPAVKIDILIAVDTSDIERLNINNLLKIQNPKLFVLDHHTYVGKWNGNIYIDKNAESVAEILYDLVENLNIKFDDRIKKNILLGILGDSGFLRFAKNKKVLEILPKLYTPKISLRKMYKNLFGFNISDFKILNKLLLKGELRNNILWCYFNNKNNKSLRKIIYFLTMLKEAHTFILIEKIKNQFYVHLRSDKINVGRIAKRFNGGGHKFSAGFKTNIPISKLKKKILKLI
ncbi:MAG: DHH family phosphoesterase [Candidatus Parvarchaeota archaeon]|nr:DHH family phosphoesterase [Candidatus Rehaiarchaeum fermentans]